MIKNIVFDMGNVLIYFNRSIFLDRVGVASPDEREILLREIYLSLEWSQMDRGALTDAEAVSIMKKRVPERLKHYVDELVRWDHPLLPIPGVEELVRELKEKRYGIYLLSNASFHQHDYWERVPAWECFDGTMISADEHLVKPQPEIYLRLCSKYSLVPNECVFIDDSTPNCEGAYYSGMATVVFHDDVRELRQKLKALGVDCAV